MFATGPGLKSLLVLQFWASYSSQWAGIFIITLLISSVCSTKWTLVLWVSPYMRVLCTLFFPPSPPVEKHHKLQWVMQGLPFLQASCPLASYSYFVKLKCSCKNASKPTLICLKNWWKQFPAFPAESYQLSNMEMTFLDFQRSNLPCHIGSVSVYEIRKLLESGRIFYINNYIWNCLVNNLLILVLQHDFVMLLLIL